MTERKVTPEMIDELYNMFTSLETADDFRDFFDDLCTYKEIEQMAQRLKAAKLLIEGNTYNKVIEETDISSATLSRVSRSVQYGKGYSRFIKRNK